MQPKHDLAPHDSASILRDVSITRRSALFLLAGTTVALACSPRFAWGDDGSQDYESFASSWRYSGGEKLEFPSTDVANNASQLSALDTTTTSTYSTWSAANGTSSYLIQTDTTTDDETTTTTEQVTTSGVARVGVDVSKYQGDIDWSSVAADGISFAIIRCGYGSDYESQDDSKFLENVEGALAAGLSIGVYLYSYATQTSGSDGSAASEAEHVLRLLDEAGLEPSDLDLPVFLDFEDSSQTGLGASTLGDIARVFCNTLVNAGYKVGIYANKYWWSTYLTDDVFSTSKWYRWVARYPTTTESNVSGISSTSMWQFTSKGTVSGIDGSVDVNFDYAGKGSYGVASYVAADLQGTISWRAHIQTYGWTSGTSDLTDTVTMGTTGLSKRMEAIKLSLNDTGLSGSITYRVHCQTYGWLDWVSDGDLAGTTGESKRLESLQIKLTGELAQNYDIYYRVHCQTYGWLDWACNGAQAGTSGYSKRAEAIKIKIVKKGASAPGATDTPFVNKATLSVQAHQQSYGWLDAVASGETAGKAGSGKRMEALKISISSKVSGSITYRAHCQTYGWLDWVSDGTTAGTTGKSKRMEALQIKLTGEAAENYTIWYRSYVQGYGWLGWATDGATSGTTGMSKRIEAVQVKILAKKASAPGSTSHTYYSS